MLSAQWRSRVPYGLTSVFDELVIFLGCYRLGHYQYLGQRIDILQAGDPVIYIALLIAPDLFIELGQRVGKLKEPPAIEHQDYRVTFLLRTIVPISGYRNTGPILGDGACQQRRASPLTAKNLIMRACRRLRTSTRGADRVAGPINRATREPASLINEQM